MERMEVIQHSDSPSLITLQEEIATIKKTLAHDIPALRHEVTILKAQVADQQQLTSSSGNFQNETRTHEDKLASAMKNGSLVRIAVGKSLPDGRMPLAEMYTQEAEELERLAKKLRQWALKVTEGGKAYILEAEDAEALAIHLRSMAVNVGADASVRGSGREAYSCITGIQEAVSAITNTTHKADANVINGTQESNAGAVEDATVGGASKVDESVVETIEAGSEANDTMSLGSERALTIQDQTDNLEATIDETPESMTAHTHDDASSLSDISSDTASTITSIPPLHIAWKPRSLRAIPSLSNDILSLIPDAKATTTFSWKFLRSFLSGERWCGGFHHVPESQPSLLPNRGYWLLDADLEPLMPSTPGEHGCALTPSLRPDGPEGPNKAAYQEAPVFVKRADNKYVYFGSYTPPRRPDRLDFDRTQNIPLSVKEYWANQLCDTAARPKWVTEQLKSHLFGRPTYDGPLPSTENPVPANNALRNYGRELAAWDRDSSLRVSLLKRENLLLAFEVADTEDDPGIRFWCQYLECRDWDKGFYDLLVREQKKAEGLETGDGDVDVGLRVERDRQRQMEMQLDMWAPRPRKP